MAGQIIWFIDNYNEGDFKTLAQLIIEESDYVKRIVAHSEKLKEKLVKESQLTLF